MRKSRIEVSDDVLGQLLALQHEVCAEQLQPLFFQLLEDLKQADWMDRYRVCCVCDSIAQEGYVIESSNFYCSDKCLHQHISIEQYQELYADGEGDSYWTNWY